MKVQPVVQRHSDGVHRLRKHAPLPAVHFFSEPFELIVILEQMAAPDVPEKVIGQILDVPLPKPDTTMRREVLAAQRFEFLESFRSIRSALWFMGQNGNKPKTILIASSVPQEGKSTIAEGLGCLRQITLLLVVT